MVKTVPFVLGLISLELLAACPVTAGLTDSNLPSCRLTIELRDGSRVIGEPIHNQIQFHSSLLGNLKLAVKDIRSIECVSSNSAKLSTTGGDTLTVWFMDPNVIVKTSFGQIDLRATSIRTMSVYAANPVGGHRPGLVALWSGENNGKDSIGTNDAELTDMNFADGQVGRSFSLNGNSSWAKIPANPSLDVGKSDGLTISAWIKPMNVNSFHPILEWEVTVQKNSVQLWIGHMPQDRGVLFGNIGDDQGVSHVLCSPPGTIIRGRFQHIVMTYDKTSGIGRLLVNGQIVAEENLGIFTPHTIDDIFISRRPCDHPGDWTYNTFFDGLLDEVAIYNHALSIKEIEAIELEGNHGESLSTISRGSFQ